MGLQRVMMEVFYRVGFTPWDGHAQTGKLTELVEGVHALPPGKALDIGCGTGDASIYLVRHGWDVTAVDFVKVALERARAKADAKGVAVHGKIRFVHGDATRLSEYGVGTGFQLAVDNGCLHGLSDEGRDAYVRELSAAVTAGGRLVIAAFAEGNRSGPRGISEAEIERRFSSGWKLVSSDSDMAVSRSKDLIHVYELMRTWAGKPLAKNR